MCRSIVLRLLCLILSLSSNVRLCYSSPIPLGFSAVLTDTVDLDLQARLLSDEIDCDFNNGSFCQLHNNGGWSFQQSLLELTQKNLSTNENASFPGPSKPNHYICADWGGTDENTSPEESIRRSAELQAFISLPSPRQHHLSSGNVFYLGTGSMWSLLTVEKEIEKKSYSQKFGLCLKLSVRFSSHDASKLTVKFRSSSQTIEAAKMPGPRAVPTQAPSFKDRLIFLSYLASWIFSLPFSPSSSFHFLSQRQSSRHLKPPTYQWLHFTMPLDTQFFHPESPIPFALYGYNGVCIDNIRVERCTTTILSTLSWPPNNTLYLALSLPSSTILSSTNNSTEYFNRPLFTGAFLFTVLLVILLVLLILICVMSVFCGRKRGNAVLKKKGKMEQKKVPLVLPSMDLMRSPSVSSLPAAVVHQRQIEEISYSTNDECEETLKDADCLDDGRRRRHGDLRRPHKRPSRRPRSVFDDGGLHSGRSQRFHREISEQLSSSPASRRGKRQSTAPLLSPQRFNWRRSTEPKADAIDAVSSRSVFQRFSLLLSINENNELVLVSPEIANASSNERKNDASTSSAVSKDAGTGSAGTSGSSISTSTSCTTTTTTPAGTCSSGRQLSSLEAEATLQEMAASVSQLGREVLRKRNADDDDDETESSASVVESITSSIACLPHDHLMAEQKSLHLS